MEDFAGAHEAPCIDVETLRSATPPRWTAAAHWEEAQSSAA